LQKKSRAKKYAGALFAIALEEGNEKQTGKELMSLSSTTAGSGQLSAALVNPMYDLKERQELGEAICERLECSPGVRRFLEVLVETRDVALLPDISGSYSLMEDEHEGRLHVVLEAPWEPDGETERKIKEKLHGLTGKEIILNYKVNSDLMGGIVLRVGNTILDSSIKSQLERVQEKIVEGVM